ncbi:uncharacterized protein METZ01_LOCUS248210, partial [marine metagenome]
MNDQLHSFEFLIKYFDLAQHVSSDEFIQFFQNSLTHLTGRHL